MCGIPIGAVSGIAGHSCVTIIIAIITLTPSIHASIAMHLCMCSAIQDLESSGIVAAFIVFQVRL